MLWLRGLSRNLRRRARTAWMEVSKGRDPTLNLPLCFNLKRGQVYLGSLDSVTQAMFTGNSLPSFAQSKPGPGSCLRPGAMCSCPAT